MVLYPEMFFHTFHSRRKDTADRTNWPRSVMEIFGSVNADMF